MPNNFNAANMIGAQDEKFQRQYNYLIQLLDQKIKMLTAEIVAGITITDGVLTISTADTSTTGLLSSTDWNTFNGKQNALTFGIADTNKVQIDSSSVADNEYARFTASGLESRSTSEVLSDIGAQASLTFGIADTNAVKIDHASVADNDFAKFTSTGLEGRSYSETLSDIGAQASLTFGIADTNALQVNDATVADNDYAKFTATGIEGVPYSTVLSDIGAQAAGNELAALQALADTVGFIRKTGDGTYEINTEVDTILSQFEADGTYCATGDATTWEDLRFSAISTKLGGSKDPGFAKFKDNGSGSTGVFTYWFDSGAEEELYFIAQMPHSWKGTTIYPHVHWTPATTSDGNPANQTVEWGMEYTWADIGSTFGNTSFVYGKVHSPADADVVAGKHYLTPLSTIAPSASQDGLSSMLICRVFRNATDATDDTYEADAGLLEIDFHYEQDTLGSRTESAK